MILDSFRECQSLTLQVTDWLAQLANFKTWPANVNLELDIRSSHILTVSSVYIGSGDGVMNGSCI